MLSIPEKPRRLARRMLALLAAALLAAASFVTLTFAGVPPIWAGVAGAVAGLVTAWWRRRHPCALGAAFAYGPWLYLGAWLAFLSP